MPLKDQIKNYAKKLVEDRPDAARLRAMLRPRKPLSLIFSDDGIIPNNPRFPVIIYRGAVKVSGSRFFLGRRRFRILRSKRERLHGSLTQACRVAFP